MDKSLTESEAEPEDKSWKEDTSQAVLPQKEAGRWGSSCKETPLSEERRYSRLFYGDRMTDREEKN